MSKNCRDCRFWVFNGRKIWGECHRFPPCHTQPNRFVAEPIPVPLGQFPWVMDDEWCGEWQSKPKRKRS